MIQKLTISNFKIHDHTEIEFAPVTLLTGMNGMGKSSVIQSLLLLRQSYRKSQLPYGLNLIGDLCSVGTSSDVECQYSNSDVLKLELQFDSKSVDFEFEYPSKQNLTFLHRINKTRDFLRTNALFNRNFQYLSANRFGPQQVYSRNTWLVQAENQLSEINGRCEYAVHYLLENKRNRVLPELSYSNETGQDLSLEKQVQLWLGEISPNISVEIEESGSELKLKYNYKYPNTFTAQSIPATNTGFGISYALPILVAILGARKDSLIFIENPEAHLHPLGVIALTKLFAKAVKAGIQIVVETHSDRVIVGMLEAVNSKQISSSGLSLYLFESETNRHVSVANKIGIQPSGYLQPNAPKAFYDIIDLNYLSSQLPNP